MNWDAVGAIGEIIGALAVFVTLAYLAVQIRQNTKAVSASALDSSVNAVSAIRSTVLASSEVTEILLKGYENPEGLTEVERARFRLLLTNVLWSALNLYAQSNYAGLSEGIWVSQKHVLERILDTPGGKWFWANYRQEFESGFAGEVDKIIAELGSE